MKLENFEQEYRKEIDALKSVRFKSVQPRPFLYPTYQVVYRRAISFAFAIPAFAFVLAFFFYPAKNGDATLAMLEDSNQRIISQINSLDE